MCPATVQDDTQITTHSYLVTGKPQPTVDFGPMRAAAGIDVLRPLAPPEFWRAIVESRPTEILTHFDQDKRRYRSTGLRDVLVRQEAFERVWGSTALEHYHEDDSSLLCAIHEMRKVGRTTTECPPELAGLAGLAGLVADAFLSHVPEFTIAIEGLTIALTPLPVVGKVRIPKAKLDGLVYDLASGNPRLARIQVASLLAPCPRVQEELGVRDARRAGFRGQLLLLRR